MNNHPVFAMMMGLPASGKSSYAQSLDYHDSDSVVVVSSDSIREELGAKNGSKADNQRVFELLHKRVKQSLRDGKNVIYDATNLSHRRRTHFIKQELKTIPCKKRLILILKPVDLCIKDDLKRDNSVGADVIKKFWMKFQPPAYSEGWDEIEIRFDEDRLDESTNLNYILDFYTGELTVNQENSHHRFDLLQHMITTAVNVKLNDPELFNAAYYHDCGKLFTKSEPDENGDCHYRNHENVGAYEYMLLASMSTASKEEILPTANLIYLHMLPYKWDNNSELEAKHRKELGETIYNQLKILHAADVVAH